LVQLAPPIPLLAIPNVTAHPSTASLLITVLLYDPLLCGYNVASKGLKSPSRVVSYSSNKGGYNLGLVARVDLLLFRYRLRVDMHEFLNKIGE